MTMTGKTQAEIKVLRNKINALALAAAEPVGEFETGGGGVSGFHVTNADRIEKCADEALALVDELAGEIF